MALRAFGLPFIPLARQAGCLNGTPPALVPHLCTSTTGIFIEQKIENRPAFSVTQPQVPIHVYGDGFAGGAKVMLARYADRLHFNRRRHLDVDATNIFLTRTLVG
jgi:hypothetical protein